MMAEEWIWGVFWLAAGAAFGSFFTVAGLRLPLRRSVIRPPSACPECGNRIKGVDLVPLLGWVWRRGKCRECRAPISPLYPFVEIVTGLCFLLLFWKHDSVDVWAAGLALVSLLTVLTVSDLRYRLLPNRIVYPAFIVFIAYRIVFHPLPLWQYAVGLAMGGGLLWVVSWAGLRFNRPAMGGGDIKLMALLGWLLGFEQVLFIILLSSLMGLLAGVALIAARKMTRQTFLPFGPFISLAAVVSWIWGSSIVQAYLQWYSHTGT